MNPSAPLESVVFIALPENVSLSTHAFTIDPAIPLPVQKNTASEDAFDPTSLTQEMIFAGILTVLAYDAQNEHVSYYRQLLQSARPDIKQELTEAAILKARNEDFEIAEEIFAALRGLDPDDIATVLNTALFFDQRAESYRKSGLNEDADAYDQSAHQYYKQAMAADPAPPDAFFNAGFFYLKQRNFSRAKNCFETYLTLTGDLADDDLGENGRYKKERAKEIVEDISSRNLEDEQFKAAFDFISMGQEERGLEEIRTFLQKNPKVWNAWFLLGWGLRRLERWTDAKSAFLQAIECGSTGADTYNELAICHMELGEYAESRKRLVQALEAEPENTKIMSNLGYLALKQDRTAEAKKYFLSVLEFDPDDAIAKSMIAKLES
ncbi:tetratricopeptide repeat protein [Treponema brennaborense]|uniref:Tetratricopeptide TPR_2 repeat-containing protein n=1 Tax=Treponema brennaborense (strain DSM 12168 / CIP 105900 / DD5/3) TaxID=906968 RepID=F4LNP6_TREBD|nr:tetratricopeptide repeat protein [Treponema brennaborense]AEE16881.1 Tetratricopeptide TPR_2 repeat-containing protein [Treponema brennaborense DSM 12168]